MQQKQTATAVKPEEVQEWRTHPCTEAFLQDLRERVAEAKGEWAAGLFQSETIEATALRNAKAIGGIQLLATLIQFLEGEEA